MIKSKQLVKEYVETIGKYSYDQRDCIGSIWKILEKYGAETGLLGSSWFARYGAEFAPINQQKSVIWWLCVRETILRGSWIWFAAKVKHESD